VCMMYIMCFGVVSVCIWFIFCVCGVYDDLVDSFCIYVFGINSLSE